MPYHPAQPNSVFSVAERVGTRQPHQEFECPDGVGSSCCLGTSWLSTLPSRTWLCRSLSIYAYRSSSSVSPIFLVKPRASHLIRQIFELVFEDDLDILRQVRPNEPV